MLMVRRNNYSNWLDNFFDDSLSDTELMPQSDTMSFTVILSRGYRFKSFTNEFIMARWVFGLDRRSPPSPKYTKCFRVL